jgi:hypothetical protein
MKQILDILRNTTLAEWAGDLVGIACLALIFYGVLHIGLTLAPGVM